MGGRDYFSNGIHLNVIEAAENPAAESWRNLQRDQRRRAGHRRDRLASRGLGARRRRRRRWSAAGACRRLRGGARGHRPEPLLPAHGRAIRVGILDIPAAPANRGRDDLPPGQPPFTPVGARQAVRSASLDATFGATLERFDHHTRRLAERLASDAGLERRLAQKRRRRAHDQQLKPYMFTETKSWPAPKMFLRPRP